MGINAKLPDATTRDAMKLFENAINIAAVADIFDLDALRLAAKWIFQQALKEKDDFTRVFLNSVGLFLEFKANEFENGKAQTNNREGGLLIKPPSPIVKL